MASAVRSVKQKSFIFMKTDIFDQNNICTYKLVSPKRSCSSVSSVLVNSLSMVFFVCLFFYLFLRKF